MKHFTISVRQAALALTLALTLALAACGGSTARAATMKLAKTEGAVDVSDGDGASVPMAENLGLYSGYRVATQAESFAWIDLDDAKRTKMDEESAVCVHQEDRALELEVLSGSLYFDITEPLADDETLEIRTSSMVVGIRGTRGWVEVFSAQQLRVYLLEGKVECTNGTDTASVSAGQAADIRAEGAIEVFAFSEDDIPAFVRAETEGAAASGAADGAASVPKAALSAPSAGADGTDRSGEAHDVFWLRDHPTYTAASAYSAEGELYGRLESTYNESGLLVRMGSDESYTEYLYDAQNRLTGYRGVQGGAVMAEWYVSENTAERRTYRTPVNDVQYIYEWFDEAGRPVRRETFRKENDMATYSEYVYDDLGRMAQVNTYFIGTDGTASLNNYIVYEYD